MTIRIVIADDHPVVLDGLARLFAVERDFEVVVSAKNGDEALRAVRTFGPDILVLDLRMPGKDGIAVLNDMKRDGSATRVVVNPAGPSPASTSSAASSTRRRRSRLRACIGALRRLSLDGERLTVLT